MDNSTSLPTLTERLAFNRPADIGALTIWEMQRNGALDAGFEIEFEAEDSLGKSTIRLRTSSDAVVITIGSSVQILGVTHTKCGLGGRRPWWKCPDCGSRRGVLFFRGRHWTCRGCMGLPYRSQRLSNLERAKTKVRRLRAMLGDGGSLLDDLPPKPHGMRRRTYLRRREELTEATGRVLKLSMQAYRKLVGPDGPPLSTELTPDTSKSRDA